MSGLGGAYAPPNPDMNGLLRLFARAVRQDLVELGGGFLDHRVGGFGLGLAAEAADLAGGADEFGQCPAQVSLAARVELLPGERALGPLGHLGGDPASLVGELVEALAVLFLRDDKAARFELAECRVDGAGARLPATPAALL